MRRISTATRVQDKFGPGRDGFADGNPTTGSPSTQLEANWFDSTQEEIARAIELSGITLDSSNVEQLFAAINARITAATGGFVLKAGDTMTGALTITTAANDPLRIIAPAGNQAAIVQSVTGGRSWQTRGGTDGRWYVEDNTAGAVRLSCDNAGQWYLADRLQVATGTDWPVRIETLGAGLNCGIWFFGLGSGQYAMGVIPGGQFQVRDQTRLTAISVWHPLSGDFEIFAEGRKPGGGSWGGPSDARIKTVTGSYTQGLAEIEQLNPVIYRYNGNHAYGPGETAAIDTRKQYIGLIAQDVENIMPEMVTKTEGVIDGNPVNDFRQMNTTPMLFAIVNAMKEVSQRLQTLEARLR